MAALLSGVDTGRRGGPWEYRAQSCASLKAEMGSTVHRCWSTAAQWQTCCQLHCACITRVCCSMLPHKAQPLTTYCTAAEGGTSICYLLTHPPMNSTADRRRGETLPGPAAASPTLCSAALMRSLLLQAVHNPNSSTAEEAGSAGRVCHV
jgi:hypothetical protein